VSINRPALVALLVGVALLASPAVLLQFQEPAECMNAVDPAGSVKVDDSTPVFQYEDLSADAKRAFDRAQGAGRSVAVYGDRCPAEFTYSAGQERYVVVKNDSRYVLTTYENDLVPEVPIAAGTLALFGFALVGIGLATRDDESRFPLLTAAIGLLLLVGVTIAVVLDQRVFTAVGVTGIATAGTLVAAGGALPPRRALLLGGALSVVPAVVLVPLVGVSLLFLVPAVLPLLLVGTGVGIGSVVSAVESHTADE
jgi:hypothetical protein